MTPEEIKSYLSAKRPFLIPDPLPTEGKGYSFFYGPKTKTNRIIRVSRHTAGAVTKMRLAVSKRLKIGTDETEISFTGGLEDLLRLVDQEINFYRKDLEISEE